MATTILIADDHAIVREGICNLIVKSRPDWALCEQAADGEEALALARSLQPTVVILDITMPKMSGLEVAARISQHTPHSRILMFTMHESPRLNIEAQQAGAHGVVLKSQATRDLIRAIDRLLSGDTFFELIEEKEESAQPIFRRKHHYESTALWCRRLPSVILESGAQLLKRDFSPQPGLILNSAL
jgi:DNA-binding NarL/FixJ family response regulator